MIVIGGSERDLFSDISMLSERHIAHRTEADRTGTPENNLLCFAHIKYHFIFDGTVLYVLEFIDNVYVSVFRDN